MTNEQEKELTMKEWFVPFRDLIKMIEYETKKYTIEAKIGAHFIGEVQIGNDLDIKEWKKRLCKSIARFSSTAILETACGCSKLIELYRFDQIEIIVPLKIDTRSFFSEYSDFDAATPAAARAFEFHGKLGAYGLKLFTERMEK